MIKYIRQNDTKPYLQAVISEVLSNPLRAEPVDLTSCTVKFIMRRTGAAAAKVGAAVEIVDGLNGVVQYKWAAADTDTPGDYIAEFEVTDTGNKVTTYWDLRTAEAIDDGDPPEPLIIRVLPELETA